MKSFTAIAAFAGAVAAQTLPSGSCSQLCINNMSRIAQSEMMCTAGDASCFCTRSNWAYGVRDCSREACDEEQSAAAISYAALLCQGVEGQPDAIPILTSALATSLPAPTATGSGIPPISSAILSASSMISSLRSEADDDAESATASIGSEFSSATASIGSEFSSATASIGSEFESATASIGSEFSSATASIGSGISSATDSLGSAIASATDGEGKGPQQTALPMLAGAGAFAMFFL